MRDRLVLPRYNSVGAAGAMTTTSPTTPGSSPGISPSTSPNGSQREAPLERGDSILLDIEGGEEMADVTMSKRSQWTLWRPDLIASPFRTAVVSNLGSAVSSGWSRARGAMLGSSVTLYVRRVPALEKPFDLKDIPSGPNDI